MKKLSDEQRRVLKRLAKNPGSSPRECRTGTRTFVALSKRGLIHVDTTFDTVFFPLTNARAELSEAGEVFLLGGK